MKTGAEISVPAQKQIAIASLSRKVKTALAFPIILAKQLTRCG